MEYNYFKFVELCSNVVPDPILPSENVQETIRRTSDSELSPHGKCLIIKFTGQQNTYLEDPKEFVNNQPHQFPTPRDEQQAKVGIGIFTFMDRDLMSWRDGYSLLLIDFF